MYPHRCAAARLAWPSVKRPPAAPHGEEKICRNRWRLPADTACMSRNRVLPIVVLALSALGFGSSVYLFATSLMLEHHCGLGRDLACADGFLLSRVASFIGLVALTAAIFGIVLYRRSQEPKPKIDWVSVPRHR